MVQENLPVPAEELDALPVPVQAELLAELRDAEGPVFLRYPSPVAEEAGAVALIARKDPPDGVPKGVIVSREGVYAYPERSSVSLSRFLRQLLAKIPPSRTACVRYVNRSPGGIPACSRASSPRPPTGPGSPARRPM